MTDQSMRFGTVPAGGAGSFVDAEALLPLFADPDARGSRKWSDMFDPDACDEIDASDILAQIAPLF